MNNFPIFKKMQVLRFNLEKGLAKVSSTIGTYLRVKGLNEDGTGKWNKEDNHFQLCPFFLNEF